MSKYYFENNQTPRKLLRLPRYNYELAGYYYVTLCTQNRQCLFGDIKNDNMVLNDVGLMIHNIWSDIPNKYSCFSNDLFVLMPNHLHGILIINDKLGPAQGPAPTLSLSDVLRNFKSLTTTCYMKGVDTNKFKPFEKKLWQRSYYEHVIRRNKSLDKIREYILNNPRKWHEDLNNPNVGAGPCVGPRANNSRGHYEKILSQNY